MSTARPPASQAGPLMPAFPGRMRPGMPAGAAGGRGACGGRVRAPGPGDWGLRMTVKGYFAACGCRKMSQLKWRPARFRGSSDKPGRDI